MNFHLGRLNNNNSKYSCDILALPVLGKFCYLHLVSRLNQASQSHFRTHRASYFSSGIQQNDDCVYGTVFRRE